jgi:hypothetical protein
MADAALTSARFGDVDALREVLRSAEGGAKDTLVNFVQEGTLNTPLHMGTTAVSADALAVANMTNASAWWMQRARTDTLSAPRS